MLGKKIFDIFIIDVFLDLLIVVRGVMCVISIVGGFCNFYIDGKFYRIVMGKLFNKFLLYYLVEI